MPISLRRLTTAYAVTPPRPTQASSSAKKPRITKIADSHWPSEFNPVEILLHGVHVENRETGMERCHAVAHDRHGVPARGGAHQDGNALRPVLAKPLGREGQKHRGRRSGNQESGPHIARQADHGVAPFPLANAAANGVPGAEQRARGGLTEDGGPRRDAL